MKTSTPPISIQNVLLTGITGYLGSLLAIALVKNGYRVFGLVRNLSDTRRLGPILDKITLYKVEENGINRSFVENRIDAVVHCATCYGRKNETYEEILEANFNYPTAVLQKGVSCGLRYFFNTHTMLDPDVNSYAKTKHAFSDLIKSKASTIVHADVTLEHFYGPKDDSTKFVSWVIANGLNQSPSLPLTLGHQERDFIYIDDVVDAFIHLIRWSPQLGLFGSFSFQIGSGQLVSVKETVELIFQLCGNQTTRLEFGKIPYRLGEKMTVNIDLTNIKKTGWAPHTSLRDGLIKTIQIEKSLRNESLP